MKAYEHLPEGYAKIYSIDLQKNVKTAILVNLLAGVIAALMVIPVHFAVPIQTLFFPVGGVGELQIKTVVMIGAMILYMILHELVHGVAMKICGTKKVKYGVTGIYAFAGSEDLYDKKSYIFVALAPVVFWGVVLLIINLFVPLGWFWVVYLIQIANISGAAGDFFVTVKFLKMPRDILVQDYGVGMTVYSKEEIRALK